jgi:DNA-binding SARP family transcriptional activator
MFAPDADPFDGAASTGTTGRSPPRPLLIVASAAGILAVLGGLDIRRRLSTRRMSAPAQDTLLAEASRADGVPHTPSHPESHVSFEEARVANSSAEPIEAGDSAGEQHGSAAIGIPQGAGIDFAGLPVAEQRDHEGRSDVMVIDDSRAAAGTPTAILQIYGLGLARVVVGGRTLTSKDWKASTSRDLFFYLICEGPATRDQLASIFWPNSSFDQIRNTFHNALYRARGALSAVKDVIVFENNTYGFNRQLDYSFDVEMLEKQLKAARTLTTNDPSGAIKLYSKAVDLYQGDFLEDYASPNDEWRVIRASGLLEKYLDASEKLGILLIERGRYEDALKAYKRAQERDPYRESAGRGVMLSYAKLGHRVEALRQYQELKARIKAELGTSVTEETEQLYQRIRSDRPLPP